MTCLFTICQHPCNRRQLKQKHNMFRQAIRRYATLPKYALEPAFGAPDKAAAETFKKSIEATTHHAKSTSGLWYKITYFVAFPAIGLAALNTYFIEKEHFDHRKHLKHVPDEQWPQDHEYQNIRSKPFFWGDGDKTLFWNPVINRHVSRD